MTVDPLPPHLRVAIVGGGPGGLSTAIALSKVPNVDVTIYEQASMLKEAGAGISIGQNTWNVLELLGVADTLTSGHVTSTVLNLNGKTGEVLHRVERTKSENRPNIRTQRTKLQSALLSHVRPGIIQLSKRLLRVIDKVSNGVELQFQDGTVVTADLVIGADGIRSVVRDIAWPGYEIKFTGTTIWRALLPWDDVKDLDPRFGTTAWWHLPTTHVYLSPVGESLGEIAARSWQDPATHSASKVSWGVPVTKAHVEAHFTVGNTNLPVKAAVCLPLTMRQDYLPAVREVLSKVHEGDWREFAAFAGPELSELTAWNNKIVLVGDSSHALSGAFGSGAGFAMEDGWILAQTLAYFRNDLSRALPLFNDIRVPYYSRMYGHLQKEAARREAKLREMGDVSEDDRVRMKVIKDGGSDMSWIYGNNIAEVWRTALEDIKGSSKVHMELAALNSI
ncbi:FAD/NAD(P)-binding domain-containing protein [Heliocybe sulcata]|uniref:FAD/NAD(P)-binding domain-containing protein n=1 Tax=Heliocybe sulcata TaxID=5364 RepID=A0A5C3MRY7_9AGAM|nr:FAD/NAD(P)-binding domain-containing protein [Heliocybe sulcata]